MLNREQILSAKDRAQQVIEVAEWGGDVTITALSVRDRSLVLAQWARLAAEQKDGDPVRLMADIKLNLVALSITDPDGVPLFSLDDVAALATKSESVIGAIADAVIILNRFTVSATEDAAKN